MGKDDNGRCVFPLTSLQIGDLQSYLSDLSLFLAVESKKFYILVDNRPWLKDLGSRSAHWWQLMVTKYRLSPFANTKGRRERKARNEASSTASTAESKKFERWFSLIDASTLSKKRVLLPVKKLRNSLLQSSELHRTLYGFIVFEVSWSNVRGINYLNELQTDTSLAVEAKSMRRWEFDSIAQAVGCLSSWFSGTLYEKHHLKEYLDSAIGEVFYDAEEDFPRTVPVNDDIESTCDDNLSFMENSPCGLYGSFTVYPVSVEDETETDMPHTPPPTGPYKRRKVTKAVKNGVEVDVYCEERQSQVKDTLNCSEADEHENAVEPTHYRDVLLLFRFNDRDLPFKLKQIIMSDLRLLTLLEAGLPSWVLFLQSYPGFCHIYRPWMCPLARALYVLISIVTVIIGFYDLYKNVPVLKATASRLCGPLFDWIETWEMVSRIKYLGTMLFLHNFQKAIKWFLMVTHATRSFFSYFTLPLTEPVMEFLELFVPLWTMLSKTAGSSFSVIWIMIESSCNLLEDLIKVILQPAWLILTTIWNIAITVLYPIFWILWETLYAPIRLVRALFNSVAFVFACTSDFLGHIWRSLSSIFQIASATEATVSSYEVPMWRSLWNDLFSQVFRALRSILNGFVAFFAACNRHRLSIYNHVHDFIKRLIRGQQSQATDPSTRSTPEGRYPVSHHMCMTLYDL
ncbi:hypothetical protein SLEP1_g34385 [Rubroshorea leprosula]|uniref:Uncharacterized protein n=2 Tax=Rubroshorea leprosula TaxID=152421 RepID=A0AAV5KJQ3_9ROSI|nr:hypothetical protein SLEP1_g34385 [Rubroshorea leprosula]